LTRKDPKDTKKSTKHRTGDPREALIFTLAFFFVSFGLFLVYFCFREPAELAGLMD